MLNFESDKPCSIAIYTRVSTDEQAREGISLHEQQERLLSYCKAMGWNIENRLYIDDGFSAKNLDRPNLKKLIKDVKAGEISKIIVTKLDRLSRRLLDLLNLIDMFQEYSVTLTSISESFDTNTPSGRLTLQVLGAVAEFERERIRERVFENMYHAAKQGKWLTQSPYGYRLVEKQLVIYEKEANIIRKIYNMYLNDGHGYYAIAKLLNENNIPSRNNKEWSIRSIKLVLTNPAYKGTLVWNRIDSSKNTRVEKDSDEWVIVDDTLPAIVSKEIWDTAQKKVSKKQIASRAQTSPHLLGGILKCGNCGSGMSISWSGSPKNRYRIYRCSANKNKGTCTSKQYRADEVEKWFKKGLLYLSSLTKQSTMLTLIENNNCKQTQSIEDKINIANKRYKRKIEAYTNGLIELQELQEEKRRLDSIWADKNDIKEHNITFDFKKLEEYIQNNITDIITAIDNLPTEKTKGIISTFIERVTLIDNMKLEIELQL